MIRTLRVALALLDALAIVAAAVAVIIALTGGFTFRPFGYLVRAHSTGSLTLLLYLWVLLRYSFRRVPLLSRHTFPLTGVPDWSLARIDSTLRRLRTLTTNRATRVVVAASLLTGSLKLTLAAVHPGFFSGDDVEIHEMTLGSLLGADWPVWNLRSAFYPLTFIYPAQWLAFYAGLTNVEHLVFAGRFVVAVVSTGTIVALYRLGRARMNVPTGTIAALLLATSGISMEFGATELPRPVSAALVLGAFAALTRTSGVPSALAAGGLLGVAACLRFSEVVFFVPAVVGLALDRRWRDAVLTATSFVAVAGVIQVASDLWYWGEPLHSVRAIVDFTLVQQLSSRGYEPFWYYALAATQWADVPMLVLAVYGTPRNARLAVWVWLPILVLSLFPHKEPRYLIPTIPLLCLLAATGCVRLMQDLGSRRWQLSTAVATLLVVAVPLRLVDQVSRLHISRSDQEVALAKQIAPALNLGPVMVEQGWRFGSHLYLGHGRLVEDMAPGDVVAAVTARVEAGSIPSAVIVTTAACASTHCVPAYAAMGFVERSMHHSTSRHRVFLPQ